MTSAIQQPVSREDRELIQQLMKVLPLLVEEDKQRQVALFPPVRRSR